MNELEITKFGIKHFNTVITDNFNIVYPLINEHLMNEGGEVMSRNGATRELLNFKTTLLNPRKRCIGVAQRDINIFFLLAEAIWIVLGKRDVEFLDIFNKNMKNYSDDGQYFHAPYGWRMRKYGLDSMIKPNDSNKHYFNEYIDQITEALKMLSKDLSDRRVVISIWNPEFDLNKSGKDLPCNDMLMFKIRNNKLHLTIQNRSNDLHWGLTTNVFQFSFLLEIMANCLGVEVGTQTHNSQSLHVYNDNENCDLHTRLETGNIYDFANYENFDFNVKQTDALERFTQITILLNHIYLSIKTFDNKKIEDATCYVLENKSKYFYFVYRLLMIYTKYQNTPKESKSKMRFMCFNAICTVIGDTGMRNDIALLALNFFLKRIEKDDENYDKEYIFECIKIAKLQNSPVIELLGKF